MSPGGFLEAQLPQPVAALWGLHHSAGAPHRQPPGSARYTQGEDREDGEG